MVKKSNSKYISIKLLIANKAQPKRTNKKISQNYIKKSLKKDINVNKIKKPKSFNKSNKKIILMMKPAQWQTMTKKLKTGVKDFVATKYMKVADLAEVLGYYGLSSGVLCSSDVRSMLSGQLSASSLESAINKYL